MRGGNSSFIVSYKSYIATFKLIVQLARARNYESSGKMVKIRVNKLSFRTQMATVIEHFTRQYCQQVIYCHRSAIHSIVIQHE